MDGVAGALAPLDEVGVVTVVVCSNPHPVVRAAAAASAAIKAVDLLIYKPVCRRTNLCAFKAIADSSGNERPS